MLRIDVLIQERNFALELLTIVIVAETDENRFRTTTSASFAFWLCLFLHLVRDPWLLRYCAAEEESKLSGSASEKISSVATALMFNDEISKTSELLTTAVHLVRQQQNLRNAIFPVTGGISIFNDHIPCIPLQQCNIAATRGREQGEETNTTKRQKKR